MLKYCQCQLSTLDISVNFKIYAYFERTENPPLLATWIVDSTWEWIDLLHTLADLGMMLARDNESCHAARSTLVDTSYACSKQRAQTQMAHKQSGLNSYRPLVGPIETQGSCTTTATKSQGAHACYISDVCGHSTTVYSYTHFINEYTVPWCRCSMYLILFIIIVQNRPKVQAGTDLCNNVGTD